MSTIFLQRDLQGVADVYYAGTSARILLNGNVLFDWKTGGVIRNVHQGSYKLEVINNGIVTSSDLAIGVVVGTAGQSNTSNWYGGDSVAAAAPATYMLSGDNWVPITGDGARTFAAQLSRGLGVPVALVNGAVGGTALLGENATDGRGFWLDQGPSTLYGNFLAAVQKAGGSLEAIVWGQGETEAGNRNTDTLEYSNALEALFQRMRNDIGPNNFVISELGPTNHGTMGFEATYDDIRRAQERVAEADYDVIIGTASTDYDLMDQVHLNRVGNADQATRDALSLLDKMGVARSYVSSIGTEAGEAIQGTEGYDVIDAKGGDDTIDAGGDADLVNAGAGNDIVNAGAGDDIVRGLAGNDTIHGNDGVDLISAGSGDDTVNGDNDNDEIWGDAGNDTLSGDGGADVLYGGEGDDRLDGGAGADKMDGGNGNDTFVVDAADDSVFEVATGGNDTIESAASLTLASYPNVENVRLTGAAAAFAYGTDGDNALTGNGAANELRGLGGSDILDGAGGADTMAGGAGDDIFYIDSVDDVVVELAGEGFDTVFSSASIKVGANVEKVVLTGTADIDAIGSAGDEWIEGNAGRNRLESSGGTDTLKGCGGDDTYVLGSGNVNIVEEAGGGTDTVISSKSLVLEEFVENATLAGSENGSLTGNASANVLIGDGSNNTLTGGLGNDVLDGGGGSDTAVFAGFRSQSFVTDLGSGSFRVEGPDGVDVLRNVESLRFAGNNTAFAIATLLGTDAAATADADDLAGTGGGETIDGLGGDDRISGLGGTDILIGGAGADYLDGGEGADSLSGGTEDDTFVVSTVDDKVFENANEGTDTVLSSVSWLLGVNIENLKLQGSANIGATGNELDNTLEGNSGQNSLKGLEGADTLIGGGSADTMEGGNGNDTYYVDDLGDKIVEYSNNGVGGRDTIFTSVSYTVPVNVEAIYALGTTDIGLTGGNSNELLVGNAGANILNGGGGTDDMRGGGGNDTYYVDRSSDSVTEAANAGVDDVITTASVTLAANVENLTYAGTATASLNGNALANRITGGGGVDTLKGFDGADTLIGGAGADRMEGGNGDDTFYIDNVGDTVVEYINGGLGGTDTVYASIDATAALNVENLYALGTGNLVLKGNAGNNVIRGNAGSNVLDGGSGIDDLSGGAGDDTYYVDRKDDKITELTGEGTDSVFSSVGFGLSEDVENLTLTGSADFGFGNSGANHIVGNSGANWLLGAAGDDVLEGGGGGDRLSGGRGRDTFVLRSGQLLGLQILDFQSGQDTLQLEGFSSNASLRYSSGAWLVDDNGVSQALDIANIAHLAEADIRGGVLAHPVHAMPDQQLTEDQFGRIDIPQSVFADSDLGSGVTYSAKLADGSALPAWLTCNPVTGSLSGTPEQAAVGNLSITVTATDSASAAAAVTFRVAIANVNDAPYMLAPIADTAVSEQAAFSLQVASAFADVDPGDALMLSAKLANGSALPSWLAFNAATGTFSGVPGSTDTGTINIVVTATDKAGLIVSDAFSLNVTPVNHAPTVGTPVADQSATEGKPFAFVIASGAFADVDAGDALTLSAKLAGGSPLPSWLSFDGQTRTFSGSPKAGDAGAVEVLLTATDKGGLSASDSFAITVSKDASIPVRYNSDNFDLRNWKITLPIDGSGGSTGTAIEVKNLIGYENPKYFYDGADGAMIFNTPVDGAKSGTSKFARSELREMRNGTTVFWNLGEGGSMTGTLEVDKTPTANNGSPAGVVIGQIHASDGELCRLFYQNGVVYYIEGIVGSKKIETRFDIKDADGKFTDISLGEKFSYKLDAYQDTFKVTVYADGNTYTAVNKIKTVWNSDTFYFKAGSYVAVAKGEGTGFGQVAYYGLAIDHDPTTVNDKPVAMVRLPDAAALEDSPLSLRLPANSIVDLDTGDRLSFKLTRADGGALPPWLSFDPATLNLSGTPGAGDVGALQLRLTASDKPGASASTSFGLTVGHVNHAPTLANSPGDREAAEGEEFHYVLPADSFTDRDVGDTLSYTLGLANGEALPAWLHFDASTRTLTGTPGVDDLGILQLRLTATDQMGASASTTFGLTAGHVNHAPVAVGTIAEQAAAEGAAFSFAVPAGSFTDQDAGDTLYYSLVQADGTILPAWLHFDAATQTMSGTPGIGDFGVLQLHLTATDKAGANANTGFALTVSQAQGRIINGTSVGDILTGGAGADTISGNGGDDTLYGLGRADTLNGGEGNDLLDGGADADTMVGGNGDDRYYVDNVNDKITESYNGGLGGTDRVWSTVSYILSADVEQLTLVGTADINATGSAGDNIIIGNLGNNVIDGGSGTDRMEGGEGNDTYYVNRTTDTTVENADAGYDKVFSSVSLTLAANVEDLVLSGAAVVGTGNELANVITGGTAPITLSGGGGNDQLIGTSGADKLDGGVGDDLLRGGNGNDMYYVDSAADVIEESADGGYDTVYATASHALALNVEKLVLSGATAINGTGNGLANTIIGNAAENVIDGCEGADTMTGGDGSDTYVVDDVGDVVSETSSSSKGGTDLVKASVSYTLSANVENLTMTGSAPLSGTGNTLANLITANDVGDTLKGMSGNDTLIGGSGADFLYGGAGNDTLTGGAGNDAFVFDFTPSSSSNLDTILDFNVADDGFWLDDAVFKSLAPGALQPSAFVIGKEAMNADQHLVYDNGSGKLFYDADGLGGASQTQIASLQTDLKLTAADFLVV